jgi:ketosteroid isomerase-like protein
MDKLTQEAVREIERTHSSWIELEVAGEGHRLMPLCGDDIELWPPDAPPVLGRAAVARRKPLVVAADAGPMEIEWEETAV